MWQNLGWSTIIYMAALSGVSPELIEAARIDGCSRLQIIKNINLPTITPTAVTLLILRMGSMISTGYEKILLLQNNLNMDGSNVISLYTYQVGMLQNQFSYSTAIGLFNSLIEVVLVLTVNQISKKVNEVSLW
jgi:putative aldouronate transport system permease protein